MKRAVYTCITGGQDRKAFKEPLIVDKNMDYFMFTDSPQLYSTKVFKKILIPKLSTHDLGQARYSRKYRILGREEACLKGYDQLLYIDGYLQIISSLEPLFAECVEHVPLVVPWHDRGGLKEEVYAVIRLKKDMGEIVNKQWDLYKQEGYPVDKKILWCCGAMLINNKYPSIVEILKTWYFHILKYSYRVQLSLPYIQWKLNFPIKISRALEYDYKNSTFGKILRKRLHDKRLVV